MNKKILIIGFLSVLCISIFSGCIDLDSSSDIETIEISGIDIIQTINNSEKKINLYVSGIDCDITVTKGTIINSIDISGENCIVRVSKSHSFSSDISGLNSKIIYYD